MRIPRSRLKTSTVTRKAGHEPLVHENQKQGAKQKLVGHRVEVLADLGLLLQHSCRQAIQAIAEPGYDEEAKRGLVVRAREPQ